MIPSLATEVVTEHQEKWHQASEKYFKRNLGTQQGKNCSEQLFFRMISVGPCSTDIFPLGTACDIWYVQKYSSNYLMLTYHGKQSKAKEASLHTLSLTTLLRIAVFNLEILMEIIVG